MGYEEKHKSAYSKIIRSLLDKADPLSVFDSILRLPEDGSPEYTCLLLDELLELLESKRVGGEDLKFFYLVTT